MRASVFVMAVGMATVGAPVWAQYKCTSPSGQVSFQQQPCAGQQRQQALDLKTLPPPSAGTPAPDFAKQNAELDKRLAIRAAIEERRPVVGMTVSELQLAMGAANNVNRSQAGDVVSDQHVYQRGARTVYVYTRNGVVTSIQDTASGQASAPSHSCGRHLMTRSARPIGDGNLSKRSTRRCFSAATPRFCVDWMHCAECASPDCRHSSSCSAHQGPENLLSCALVSCRACVVTTATSCCFTSCDPSTT